jgi:hypothetical protein
MSKALTFITTNHNSRSNFIKIADKAPTPLDKVMYQKKVSERRTRNIKRFRK